MTNFQTLIQHQRDYFMQNTTKPVAFRIRQLQLFKQALKANEQAMIEAIQLDFGKSEFDTYTNELALVYTDIQEAIRKTKRWSRKKCVRTNLVNFPARSYILPEPLGVSLIISAWNYPYQLAFAPVVAAMAAGCTIILKPSEIPSRTSTVIQKIVADNFDPAYFTVVEGGVDVTTSLLEHKFDKVFFTGSVPVGKIVYQAAAKHLTPVTLELGGKSPAIITASCHIKMSVKRLVWAKYLNAGQTCIAPDYVVVENTVKDAFLAALKEEIAKSDFQLENGNYVQIITDKHFKRLEGFLASGTIFTGGKTDAATRFIEPTVLTDVEFTDSVMQEEIFGPILPVIGYSQLDTVINQIKQLPKPLACYMFSSNNPEINKILNEISFGGGAINEAIMHITNSHLPFGGVGDSGIGSYHGKAGFDAFTHYKSILRKPTWLEMNLKYSPHTARKLNIIKRIMK